MWHSPQRLSKEGKQYQLQEIAPLIQALGVALEGDLLEGDTATPNYFAEEPMLGSLSLGQYIYGLYRVCNMLLDEEPVPEEVPGYLEAILCDMLHFLYANIEMEHADSTERLWSNRAWKLFEFTQENIGNEGINRFPDPENISLEDWWSIIYDYIFSEFFEDADWRLQDILMNFADDEEGVGEFGDLCRGFANEDCEPYSPTLREFLMAKHYLLYLVSAVNALEMEEDIQSERMGFDFGMETPE